MILPLKDWKPNGISVTVPGVTNDVVAEALRTSGERVALDLHVGRTFERNHKWIEMPECLILRPNECIRIRVRELIQTSRAVFGGVCSRASLTAEGLLVSNIKVDPNFIGYLEIAVFNAGDRSISLMRDKAFASVWFATLASAIPEGEAPRVPTPTDGLAFRSWQERARVLAPYVATGVLSILGSLAAALLLKPF
jgi:deoxycytidine triphosphate deaminase